MFRFTIRDMLWLGVLLLVGCGLSAGWFLEEVRLDIENSRLRSRLSQTEGHLQELQRILEENGLGDPGYYYW